MWSGTIIRERFNTPPMPNRRRRRWTDDELRDIAARAISMADALRLLHLRVAGGNYENIWRALNRLSISTSHWTRKGRADTRPTGRAAPIEQLLRKGSSFQSNKLRKRLLKDRIFDPKCSICSHDQWLGQPIPLEVDHIDGDRENNTLGNLRLVCPNCHASTPTYRGRNIGARRVRQQDKPVSGPLHTARVVK